MFTWFGRSAPRHHGVSRRYFLKVGALGTALSLVDLLRAADRSSRKKSAILVYLPGGPSHLDTFDLKPNAPAEIRGEFRPLATNVPGLAICEQLPRLATMGDKLAVLRSVVSSEVEHQDAIVMTGYPARASQAAGHPSFGAVVSKVRGMVHGMPAFVSLRGMSGGCEPGFLGIAHRPFTVGGAGQADLKLPSGMTVARLAERKQLLSALDTLRRELDSSGALLGMDRFQQQAVEIITSGKVRQALALAQEPPEVLERYDGVEQFLKARRLIEAGVGCVTLSLGAWDTHKNNFGELKQLLPLLDRALSALVQDLHDRGLADEVVVAVWGEFGRTPIINRDAGRDHWPAVMSTVLAGGGLRMGQVIGATSARGEEPKERPYRISQVLATLYHAIGIDPGMILSDPSGRPLPLLEDREPVRELLG